MRKGDTFVDAVTVSVVLSREQQERMKGLAMLDRKSFSGVVREAIDVYLRHRAGYIQQPPQTRISNGDSATV